MKAEANYVEQTISEAVTRIAQLQDLVRGLHGLREMGRMTAVMPLPGRSSASPVRIVQKGTKATEARIAKGKVQASGRPLGQQPKPETLRVAGLVAGLAEPFTTAAVMECSGIERKQASNFCTQGKVKGWLKAAGFGKYQRTAKFPSGETAQKGTKGRKEEEQAAMLKIASANGPELERLQEELEEAIAKRDEHRDAGRTVLEGAEQKRVDKLIAKIKGS